ncbi:MAG TPA: ABC transporter permease [Solirubrobacteraceae bacterium]|nr:ABC transporter permease [Solirubrobacteraceae bacterium]
MNRADRRKDDPREDARIGAQAARTNARVGGGMRARAARILPPALLGVAALAAWELYVDAAGVDQLVLPAPHAMFTELWDNAPLLWSNFTVTAREVLLGLALALLTGFAVAVAIHLVPQLRRAVYPHAVGSQAVPIAILAVPLCFWWGFGILPKLFVIALICFFPVLVTTVDGLSRVDPEQLKLLRTLEASRLQAFRFAELPAAIPAAISGARIALAVGVIGAFIAETSTPTLGPYAGLGRQIASDLTGLQTARAYAATAVLFVFAIACFYSLTLIEHRIAPWAHENRKGEAS